MGLVLVAVSTILQAAMRTQALKTIARSLGHSQLYDQPVFKDLLHICSLPTSPSQGSLLYYMLPLSPPAHHLPALPSRLPALRSLLQSSRGASHVLVAAFEGLHPACVIFLHPTLSLGLCILIRDGQNFILEGGF